MNMKERLYFEFAKRIEAEGRTIDQYLEAIDSVLDCLKTYTIATESEGDLTIHKSTKYDVEFNGLCDMIYRELVPGVSGWFYDLITIKAKLLGCSAYWTTVNSKDSITKRIIYLNEVKDDLIYYFKTKVMSIDRKIRIIEKLYEIAHQSSLDKHMKILLREWYNENKLTLREYSFLLSAFEKCGFVSDVNNLLMIHRLQLALMSDSIGDLTVSIRELTEFFMYYKNSLGLHHISRSNISRIIESTLK